METHEVRPWLTIICRNRKIQMDLFYYNIGCHLPRCLPELTRGQSYLTFLRCSSFNSISALSHNLQMKGIECLTQLCRIYFVSFEEVLVKKGFRVRKKHFLSDALCLGPHVALLCHERGSISLFKAYY